MILDWIGMAGEVVGVIGLVSGAALALMETDAYRHLVKFFSRPAVRKSALRTTLRKPEEVQV